MTFLLREVEALLQPVGIVWAGLLVGIVVFLFKGRPGTSLYCLILSSLLFVFGSTPIPCRLLAGLERPYEFPRTTAPLQADAVIMLGGTHDFSKRGPLPFNTGEACDRVLAAVELVRERHIPNLVLGGARYENEGVIHPDSDLLETWFQRWKLPVGKVYLLGTSTNTRDEAERAIKLANENHWKRLVVVSSGYHLRRGEALFRRLGAEVVPVGCDFIGLDALDARNQWTLVPRLRTLDVMRLWLHEQIGWWYYRVKGWV